MKVKLCWIIGQGYKNNKQIKIRNFRIIRRIIWTEYSFGKFWSTKDMVRNYSKSILKKILVLVWTLSKQMRSLILGSYFKKFQPFYVLFLTSIIIKMWSDFENEGQRKEGVGEGAAYPFSFFYTPHTGMFYVGTQSKLFEKYVNCMMDALSVCIQAVTNWMFVQYRVLGKILGGASWYSKGLVIYMFIKIYMYLKYGFDTRYMSMRLWDRYIEFE